MNKILSLFDGLSGAKIALDELGVDNIYYSSEIDKYAIKVSKNQYPDITHIGDVSKLDGRQYKDFTLLIGGSPCQNLSCRGDKMGLRGSKSSLFFEFVRILEESSPKYFLLENVASMSKKNRDIISKHLNVQPIMINSNCFVPQTRRRYYWTNIPNVKITTEVTNKTVQDDILEKVDVDEKFFYNEHAKDRSFWINPYNSKPESDLKIARPLKTQPYTGRASVDNCYHVKQHPKGKTNLRRLTPLEYERLQGIPDNYTSIVSDTQRYKMVGNSFTIPVIKHILSHISW